MNRPPASPAMAARRPHGRAARPGPTQRGGRVAPRLQQGRAPAPPPAPVPAPGPAPALPHPPQRPQRGTGPAASPKACRRGVGAACSTCCSGLLGLGKARTLWAWSKARSHARKQAAAASERAPLQRLQAGHRQAADGWRRGISRRVVSTWAAGRRLTGAVRRHLRTVYGLWGVGGVLELSSCDCAGDARTRCAGLGAAGARIRPAWPPRQAARTPNLDLIALQRSFCALQRGLRRCNAGLTCQTRRQQQPASPARPHTHLPSSFLRFKITMRR